MKRWWWWDWTVTELYEMKSEKRRGSYLLIPAPMFHNKDKKGHYYNNIILWVWVWVFSFKINYFHVNVLSRHMDPWIMDNFKHGQIYTWYLQTTCILNWTIHTNVDTFLKSRILNESEFRFIQSKVCSLTTLLMRRTVCCVVCVLLFMR